MELTGWPFAAVVVAAAATAPVAVLLLWGRLRGGAVLRVLQRVGLVAWCQLTAVLVTAVLVNNQFDLYESWDDLFGGSDNGQDAQVQADSTAHGSTHSASTRGGGTSSSSNPFGQLPGQGRVLSERVRGPRSGVTSKIWVLLPAGYTDPGNASRRYPVVMFLPGYPGTPTTWLHALDLQRVVDAEVTAGRVQPFIAVLPTMNVAAPRDTECVDVVHGPQVATWLGQDVPQIVAAQTRALPPGAAWAVTGYSTGGFCAAKLALSYPGTFTSGAVLSGYFSPSNDVTTGDLYGGDQQARQQNDPQWLVTHRPSPPVHLLSVWSEQDPETAGPTKAFLAAARPPLAVDQIRLPKGGHNTSVWLGVLPQVLRWLDAHSHT
jgi:S-formylglutathione hydrolase FrmB